MEIQTTVKADIEEMKNLRSEVISKNEKNFTEYLNNLLNEAFQLGINYENGKLANKLNWKD